LRWVSVQQQPLVPHHQILRLLTRAGFNSSALADINIYKTFWNELIACIPFHFITFHSNQFQSIPFQPVAFQSSPVQPIPFQSSELLLTIPSTAVPGFGPLREP
jgi:hypothetical protein